MSADDPAPPRRRIGLLGGTFDPIHHGHLSVAVQVRHHLGLDEVWLVVANDPWQKSGRSVTPAARRLAWVETAIAGAEGLMASDVEIRLGGATYTIDTLDHLRRHHPDTDFVLIAGRDAAAGLHTWHRADELRTQVTVAVVTRPGADHLEPSPGWEIVDVPTVPIEISSTDVRRAAASGTPVDFLVPHAVAADIAADAPPWTTDGSESTPGVEG